MNPEIIMMFHEYLAARLLPKRTNERGASVVEYSLLLALIAVVCISAVTFLGNSTAGAYSDLGNSLN